MMKYSHTLLFICATLLFLVGCSKDELTQTIPWAPVEFSVNLRGADNILESASANKVFAQSRLASDRVGFSGLIVCNTGFTYENGSWILIAYDRCCPYEDMRDVVVNVSLSKGTAECLKCKTIYSLMEMGRPISGIGKESLQMYRCNPDGFNGLYRVSR